MNDFYNEILQNNTEREPKITFLKGFKFIMPLASVLHIVFLIIFLIKGVYTLAIFNMFSIFLYLYAFFIGLEKHFLKCSVAIFLEVLIHSILCSVLIGWVGGFYVYPLCLLPIVYFISINLFKKENYGHLYAFIILLNYQLCNLYAGYFSGSYEQSFLSLDKILYNFNTIAASIVLIILIYSFLHEMKFIQESLEDKNILLNELATYDYLTGLNNRRSMQHIIDNKVKELDKTGKSFCVAIADIDDFKKFNDTYGHICGDEVLKTVAHSLKNFDKEKIAHVSRWGGEEFLMLLETESKEYAKEYFEGLLRHIRESVIEYDDLKLRVTVTIGVAFINKETKDINEMLIKADVNLYSGKAKTKDCLII